MAAQSPTEPVVIEQAQAAPKSLADIMDSTEDAEDGATAIESDHSDDDAPATDIPPAEGYCIECEGMLL